MDMETYEQIPLQEEQLGDSIKFLKENMQVTVMFFDGVSIGVELPTFVELEVTETEPGFKGDTATGGSKPAKLETGAVIQVPLFIEIGDVVKVDTRTGEYISRV
jgi:elongation factor P